MHPLFFLDRSLPHGHDWRSSISVRRQPERDRSGSQHRGEPFRYARADVPGGRGDAV